MYNELDKAGKVEKGQLFSAATEALKGQEINLKTAVEVQQVSFPSV